MTTLQSPLPATRVARVHLLGAGPVGRAFLKRIEAHPELSLVALTDTQATVYARDGLDADALRRWKAGGRSLAERRGAYAVDAALAADLVAADVVVDATTTRPRYATDAWLRCRAALRGGGALVLAAKDGLARGAASLATDAALARIGCNAVLGGTGARLLAERHTLANARQVALVANGSTTALIERVEAGASPDEAIEALRADGVLEADAAQDLDGTDAALKLEVVAGLLWGIRPAIPREAFHDLDPDLLRERAGRGLTTRLVARARRGGEAAVRYEAVPRGSPLAVPSGRVAYTYRLPRGHTRAHLGAGLGPDGTADALLADVLAFATNGGAR